MSFFFFKEEGGIRYLGVTGVQTCALPIAGRVGPSPYVPDADGRAPLPAWKRIDAIQDVLPPQDRDRTGAEGGTISVGEYAERLRPGTSRRVQASSSTARLPRGVSLRFAVRRSEQQRR